MQTNDTCITPATPAKPTAATYQRRKWQEPRPTLSYHHTLLNAARRSRYRPTKHTMRQMGRLLAFLGFSKMSADDKYRTVVSIWDYMEEYNNVFPFFCTSYLLSYRAVFDRQRMAMRLSIGDEQKFLKYCDAAQAADIKFSDGTWIPVPWVDEHWTRLNPLFAIPKYPHHFVHISEEDPLQVAYADSVEKLIADRFTRTKPGRYLMKYYGDWLGDDGIRKWAERVQAMAAPAELAFIASDDPDGWKHVYREGPSSCMQGEDCVRVYAHDKSVLRLAHLVQGTTIKARCIVREDTKEYIRVYPNTDGTENNKWHMSLRERLEGLGYTHGDLEGVLLDCIEAGSGYLCPYIDSGAGSYMSASRVVRDGKSYLLLSRDGDWDAQNTSGIVNEAPRCTCPECEDDYDDDDDFVYIEYRGESVCEHCANNNYTYAYVGRRCQDYVPCDEAIYCESDGEYYARDYTDQANVYQCEVTCDWYALDDLCLTSRGLVHSDRCVALDVDDSDGNSYAYKDDVSVTHDGRKIHELEAEIRDDGLVYHENDKQVETETETEGE